MIFSWSAFLLLCVSCSLQSASATDGAACAHDEMSLVQLQQVVKHHKEVRKASDIMSPPRDIGKVIMDKAKKDLMGVIAKSKKTLIPKTVWKEANKEVQKVLLQNFQDSVTGDFGAFATNMNKVDETVKKVDTCISGLTKVVGKVVTMAKAHLARKGAPIPQGPATPEGEEPQLIDAETQAWGNILKAAQAEDADCTKNWAREVKSDELKRENELHRNLYATAWQQRRDLWDLLADLVPIKLISNRIRAKANNVDFWKLTFSSDLFDCGEEDCDDPTYDQNKVCVHDEASNADLMLYFGMVDFKLQGTMASIELFYRKPDGDLWGPHAHDTNNHVQFFEWKNQQFQDYIAPIVHASQKADKKAALEALEGPVITKAKETLLYFTSHLAAEIKGVKLIPTSAEDLSNLPRFYETQGKAFVKGIITEGKKPLLKIGLLSFNFIMGPMAKAQKAYDDFDKGKNSTGGMDLGLALCSVVVDGWKFAENVHAQAAQSSWIAGAMDYWRGTDSKLAEHCGEAVESLKTITEDFYSDEKGEAAAEPEEPDADNPDF